MGIDVKGLKPLKFRQSFFRKSSFKNGSLSGE